MAGWKYQGVNVQVPRTADIPMNYRAGAIKSWAVDEVLSNVTPWRKGDDPIETATLSRRVPAIVVPVDGRSIVWGKHRGHKARVVQVSPFVDAKNCMTNQFTIELIDSPESPVLVRAYPGEYHPPLPWMNSAGWADGGKEACLEFWRHHAYVLTRTNIEHSNGQAPGWFK